jgi:Uma2 family endonuclease
MSATAMVKPPAPTTILAYEDYLSEDVIKQRYDIVEGVRVFMSSPNWRHQRIQLNVLAVLRAYEMAFRRGLALGAPFDVLIRRTPRLQVRQPDALFISHGTLIQGGGIPTSGPLTIAPELIIEIISDSDRELVLAGKLNDYGAIGVQEVWIIHPDAQTVEILRLTPDSARSVAILTVADTLTSEIFPDLTVTIADMFLP